MSSDVPTDAFDTGGPELRDFEKEPSKRIAQVGIVVIVTLVVMLLYGLVCFFGEPRAALDGSDVVRAAGVSLSNVYPMQVSGTPVFSAGTVTMNPQPMVVNRTDLVGRRSSIPVVTGVPTYSFTVPLDGSFVTWSVPTSQVTFVASHGTETTVRFVFSHDYATQVGLWGNMFMPWTSRTVSDALSGTDEWHDMQDHGKGVLGAYVQRVIVVKPVLPAK